MKLVIDKEALSTMHRHAESTFPYECCGFFYGKDGQVRDITQAIPVENSKKGDQRRRFEISAFDYMQAEKYAAENDLALLGIYHSHPNHPATPSEHDLKQAVPFFSYIIISVMDGKVAKTTSWQLNDALKFEEETIEHETTLKQ